MSSQIICSRWWLLLLITHALNAAAEYPEIIQVSSPEAQVAVALLRGSAISQELTNLHTLEDTILNEEQHKLEAIRKQKQQLQEQVHLRKERREVLAVEIDKLKSMLEWNEDDVTTAPREPLITSQLL